MRSFLQSAVNCRGQYTAFSVARRAELAALNSGMLLNRVALNRREYPLSTLSGPKL